MYIMYVDESGDTGVSKSPTKHFALSSMIIHELRWEATLQQLIEFRRRIRDKYGLKVAEEIHASAMISKPGPLARISRNDRLSILRAFLDEITRLPDVNSINVVIDKRSTDTSDAIFDRGWRTLIQRFENTLSKRNFPGPANPDERGLIICDQTDSRLNRLLRRMRRYNPVPNQETFGPGYRDLRLKYIVEDPVHRNSKDTYFLQAVDTIAFFLYQAVAPSEFIRRRGARKQFLRLLPVLCTVATKDNPYGVVHLK
ncbi:MAG TPA: DUF3800 domain-containing protein [Thermoanaerobaculia bacterium]|jgi:hypothetical protein|nr:DUF3800 domain-containing protein [Thermoanaerobaculia bacterium]